jgi:hypothetical protein
MIFCIKNFHKNKNSSLTAKSVKFFNKDYKIYLFNIYKESVDLSELEISLFEDIINFKAKYDFGSGVGNENNGFYFSEGINHIQNYFKDYDDKVVILDEDQFFTSGKVIKELEENNFEFAWAHWPSPIWNQRDVAGNILSFNPKKINHLFPIPEEKKYIEILLRENLLDKISDEKVYKIKNRNFTNYFDDGIFTNSVADIEYHLSLKGII